jgi:hypothetical protein
VKLAERGVVVTALSFTPPWIFAFNSMGILGFHGAFGGHTGSCGVTEAIGTYCTCSFVHLSIDLPPTSNQSLGQELEA